MEWHGCKYVIEGGKYGRLGRSNHLNPEEGLSRVCLLCDRATNDLKPYCSFHIDNIPAIARLKHEISVTPRKTPTAEAREDREIIQRLMDEGHGKMLSSEEEK